MTLREFYHFESSYPRLRCIGILEISLIFLVLQVDLKLKILYL